jgi:hypothetical protein
MYISSIASIPVLKKEIAVRSYTLLFTGKGRGNSPAFTKETPLIFNWRKARNEIELEWRN